MVIIDIISPTVSFYLVVAFSLWIFLMVISTYKLKPHKAKHDVRGAFQRTAMLATTTTTGFLLGASAIYLILNYTFIQPGQVPDLLLVVAFFGSGILVIWTFSNFWAELSSASQIEQEPTRQEVKIAESRSNYLGVMPTTFGCSNPRCDHVFDVYPPSPDYVDLNLEPCREGDSKLLERECPKCKTKNERYWDKRHYYTISG